MRITERTVTKRSVQRDILLKAFNTYGFYRYVPVKVYSNGDDESPWLVASYLNVPDKYKKFVAVYTNGKLDEVRIYLRW